MENLQPATPSSEKNMNFDVRESFEINSEQKTFELKISFNEKIILFEVEEKNAFPKEDFNIFLSLEELGKINRYFFQFETTKEVFNSLKSLISKKYLTIIKEERKMKIKIINPTNDKEFFINVPLKEKDLKSEMRSIIPYVQSLNEKIKNLENKVDKLENKLNEIYIYKNDLVEIIKQKKEKKLLFEKYEIHKSNIIKKEEVKLLLSWLDKKNPSKIKLLLDSRIDGDTTETFYKKCTGKFPTVVLVQTTKGRRFGGYSSLPWKNQNGQWLEDKNNFIFSLDKQKKYNIKNPKSAIQTNSNYFAFGGGSDFVVYNNCTSSTSNYNNNSGTYNTTETYELNGENYYTILSYEVYQIEY